MTKQEKRKWVAALNSGDFKQTSGSLKRSWSDEGDRYCCLGVAAEVCQAPKMGSVMLSTTWLHGEIQDELMRFNDTEQMPFELIAGFIDAYVEPTE